MGMISIVFDDTIENQYLYAFPLMEKYELKGVLGVVTGRVGKTYLHTDDWEVKSLTWDQIEEFSKRGWEIASHSKMHRSIEGPHLNGNYSKLNEVELEEEILGSKKDLENHGYSPVTFIWVGSPDQNPCTKRELNVVKKYYKAARFFITHNLSKDYFKKPNYNSLNSSPYDLKGTWLKSYEGLIEDFKISLKNLKDNWLILSLHGVDKKVGNSVDISISEFEEILKVIKNSRVRVVTIEEGIKYLKY
ncbi:MAG: polysaccharide deacetylase family protein [Candidatus Woesearchaeota archaeon]|nr:MAG: polysaccharide deacetylase family protein [Candidatus Woesearchaeota archaeon]